MDENSISNKAMNNGQWTTMRDTISDQPGYMEGIKPWTF